MVRPQLRHPNGWFKKPPPPDFRGSLYLFLEALSGKTGLDVRDPELKKLQNEVYMKWCGRGYGTQTADLKSPRG